MGTLIWGADLLINQSERIALKFNIPEFIIGATLIALGTSLPEMAASVAASLGHKPDIAIANVIGSNVLNITLVLAAVFIIASNISPSRDFFAKDSTWALVPVLVFILMILDGIISRFDAILLMLLMGAYLVFLLQDAKNIPEEDLEDLDIGTFSWVKTIPLLMCGLVLVIIGAHFTVESAADIAKSFGISEWIIGILMVALGTSLPELVVSIKQSRYGYREHHRIQHGKYHCRTWSGRFYKSYEYRCPCLSVRYYNNDSCYFATCVCNCQQTLH